MTDSVSGLVARIRRGDRGALGEFACLYGNHIRSVARRRISRLGIASEVEPDEILDATILELCRCGERIVAIDPHEFLSYVERVVRSQANEVWRRSHARKRGGGHRRDHADARLDIPDSKDGSTGDVELEEAISRAYEALTGDERLISMMHRSGWSWDEIAERLGKTPGAVRKRWERAVARAQRLMI